MMAMTGIFTGRRRIHPLSCARNLRQFFRKRTGQCRRSTKCCIPIGLDLLALFYHHRAYERHSSASLAGAKFSNRPKSDFCL